MNLLISESQFDRIVLNEGKNRRQQAKKHTKEVINNFFANNPYLDKEVGGMPYCDYLENEIMKKFFHSRLRSSDRESFIVLEPMVANIMLHAGFGHGPENSWVYNRLTEILNYIESLYVKGEIDPRSISIDSSIQDLDEMFGSKIDNKSKDEGDGIVEVSNKDYEILDDVQYSQANEIGNYSYSGLKLCYTQSRDTWDNYTNDNKNIVYVLLHKGWKDIREEHSECLLSQYAENNDNDVVDCHYRGTDDNNNSPYDAYGLSMIFLFVNSNGSLVYSNTRWNHQAKYVNGRSVDQAFTEDDISDLLGVDFRQRFLGRHECNDYIEINELEEKLQDGATFNDLGLQYYDLCHDYRVVIKNISKQNIVSHDGKFLSKVWIDEIGKVQFQHVMVYIGDKCNIINLMTGEYVSSIWFDAAMIESNGLISVQIDGMGNVMSFSGNFLNPYWFDFCRPIGYAQYYVMYFKNGSKALADKNQIMLGTKFFKDIKVLKNGLFKLDGNYYIVQDNDLVEFNMDSRKITENYVNSQLNDDLYSIEHIDDDNRTKVYKLSERWFRVKYNSFHNAIDRDGNILSPNLWYGRLTRFQNGFARISEWSSAKMTLINEKNEMVLPEDKRWFSIIDFDYGDAAYYLMEGRGIIEYIFDTLNGGSLINDEPLPSACFVEARLGKSYLLKFYKAYNIYINGYPIFSELFARSINNVYVDDNRYVIYINSNVYTIDSNFNIRNTEDGSPCKLMNGEIVPMANESKSNELIIKEEQYNRLFLTEGKDRKQVARKRTRDVIRSYFGGSLDVDQPTDVTNGMSYCDYLESEIMEEFFHSRLRSDAKGTFIILEPMVARIALNAGWNQDNCDEGIITRLVDILNYLEGLYSKGQFDPKSLSLDSSINDLNEMFGKALDQQRATSKEERLKKQYQLNTNYEILNDVQFEQANKIGDYSFSGLRLCYTQSLETWKKYTDKGANKVYVCLSKGWKGLKERHSECLIPKYTNSKDTQKDNYYDNNGDTESSPYDAYGLSMIFLFVNPDGSLVYSNTRWNHQAKYGDGRTVDQAFTEDDISDLLGVNFEQRFPGYTPDELKEKGIRHIAFHDVQSQLDLGLNINDIVNIVYDECDGIVRVKLHNKYNYITSERKLLSSDLWFDGGYDFYNGCAIVRKDNHFNYIKTDGTLIMEDFIFDEAYDFDDGWGGIRIGEKWNFVNMQGEYISPNFWFDNVYRFCKGYAIVTKIGFGQNFITSEGNILSPDLWFLNVESFGCGYARVQINNNEWNYIDKEGNLISETNFNANDINVRCSTCWLVEKLLENGKDASYFIHESRMCYDEDKLGNHKETNLTIIKVWHYYNYIKDGHILFPNSWFDKASDMFTSGIAVVGIGSKSTFINSEGIFLLDESSRWYENAYNSWGVCCYSNDVLDDYVTAFDASTRKIIFKGDANMVMLGPTPNSYIGYNFGHSGKFVFLIYNAEHIFPDMWFDSNVVKGKGHLTNLKLDDHVYSFNESNQTLVDINTNMEYISDGKGNLVCVSDSTNESKGIGGIIISEEQYKRLFLSD